MQPSSHAVSVPVATLWTSPDSPRDVDAPIVADEPDARTWPDALSHEQQLDLGPRVLTQLLYGEPVDVIAEEGAWVEVVAPWQPSDRDSRGYPGWVRRAHVAAPAEPTGREAVVAVESAPLRQADGPARRELSYATVLPVLDGADEHDAVRVAVPGGGAGWLERSACVLRDVIPDRSTGDVDPAVVLAAARRFIGLDYLWGGMSAYGLDCSGFVHIAFRALGRVVPRDAHDQAVAGRRLPRAHARPGDLYFYARPGKGVHHVGFAVGRAEDGQRQRDVDGSDHVLHAPRTGEQVVEEPMTVDRQQTLLDYVGRFTS